MSKGAKFFFGLLTLVSGLLVLYTLALPTFGEGSLWKGDRGVSLLGYYFPFDEFVPEGVLLAAGFVIFGLYLLQGLGRGPQLSRDWSSLRSVAIVYSCILILYFSLAVTLNMKTTIGFLQAVFANVSGQSEENSGIELTADSTLDFPALPFVSPVYDPYELMLHDVDGNQKSLADFKGKAIYMNFWATWCPPCRVEMPNLEKLWESVKDSNEIVFVAISNEDTETVKKFITEKGYTFPVYTSSETLPPFYEVSGIPATMIISPDGKMVYKHTGAAAWDGGTTKKFLEALAKGEAFSKPEVEEKIPKE